MMNYLVIEGYKEAAEKFQQESGADRMSSFLFFPQQRSFTIPSFSYRNFHSKQIVIQFLSWNWFIHNFWSHGYQSCNSKRWSGRRNRKSKWLKPRGKLMSGCSAWCIMVRGVRGGWVVGGWVMWVVCGGVWVVICCGRCGALWLYIYLHT